jgi:nicotinamidase-related amidase
MHSKAFTPDNAAMLLIDHQIGTMAWTHSHDINLVKTNALKLARIAKAVSMPVVLTASMEDQVQGPLLPELTQILPEAFAQRVKRPGIINAMHHEGFNKAVKATGRKRLFVAESPLRFASYFQYCRCWRKVTKCKCRLMRQHHGRSTETIWLCAGWKLQAR